MRRAWAAVFFSVVALGQNAAEPEIVRAAKSPYDLARYINSHDDVDWDSLWHALSIDENLGLPCSMNCTAELVVVDSPEQVILILNGSLPYDVYLRYQRGEAQAWRVAGKYDADVLGNPHRHQMVRAGNTQFLVISTRGGHGSGLDEEREDWLDLSRPSFQPVFSYTIRGHFDIMGAGISSEIQAGANANSANEIEHRITVDLSYSTGGLGLGRFEFVGIYTRVPGGDFSLQEAHTSDFPPSSIPRPDFAGFARAGGASPEAEVKYALPRLKEIAAGKDDDAKRWLRYILGRIDETPEKRTLLELLAKP